MKIIETKVEAKLVKRIFDTGIYYTVVAISQDNQFETCIDEDWYHKLGGKEENLPRDSKGRFIKRR